MRTFIAVAALSVCTLAAGPAAAQTCAGRASFADAKWQTRIETGFSTDARTFGPSVARGSASLFAAVGADLTGYRGIEQSAVSVGATFGADRGVGRSGGSSDARIHLCPVVTALHQFGPSVDGADLSANVVSAGGRLGIVALENQTLQIVPVIGMDGQWEHDAVKFEGETATSSRTFTVTRLAVGFVLNKKTAIVPEIIEIFGTAGNTTFRVTASFAFPR